MIFAALIGYLGKYDRLRGDMVSGLGLLAAFEVVAEILIVGNAILK